MKVDYFIGENIKKDYFRSELIEQMAQTGAGAQSAGKKMTVYLPPKLGFCHGVVRAIRMAMYTAEKYSGRKIYLLNEMIHNPFVNSELEGLGIGFLAGAYHTENIDLEAITAKDIVIVPAFGNTTSMYDRLTEIGCTVVDTTCGEVLSVWKRVQKYNENDFTALIYGKYAHEETVATASRSKRYLIMKDLAEVEFVAQYIQASLSAESLLEHFQKASSPGFNPVTDLQRVGMASQTTMYAKEFIEASEMIKKAFVNRYGEANLNEHFLELDTICSATQERQDAIQFLLPHVDLMIVVGGYNSSNTLSLAHIASQRVPTYHIDGDRKISSEGIQHRPIGKKEEIKEKAWLPKTEQVKIGITSGASTPDSVLEKVIHEILALDGGMERESV